MQLSGVSIKHKSSSYVYTISQTDLCTFEVFHWNPVTNTYLMTPSLILRDDWDMPINVNDS